MNIIFAKKEDADALGEKYVVLELDTIRISGAAEPQTAWCVIDQTSIDIEEVPTIDQFRDLHNNMMRNYRLRNWKYCEDALEHLVGKWRKNLDSFYTELKIRIDNLKDKELDPSWDGVLDRSL